VASLRAFVQAAASRLIYRHPIDAGTAPIGRGRLLIVGGGLSAAQLALKAERSGWSHVTLVCRGPLAVRPFDIDEKWMGRHLSAHVHECEADFFAASLAERRMLLQRARPGGSITRACRLDLERLVRRGRLVLQENCTVQDAKWSIAQKAPPASADNGSQGEWRIEVTERAGEAADSSVITTNVDAVWLATGNHVDVANVAALRPLHSAQPKPAHNGLPELTPALRWDSSIPLYVAGTLAALQIGPDAFNLAGAGQCASRIISDVLGI